MNDRFILGQVENSKLYGHWSKEERQVLHLYFLCLNF